MNIVIQDLRADHHSFAQVLRYLKSASLEITDAGCWEGAISYLQTYPQQAHQLVEDLIFDTFVSKASPDSVEILNRLREEHETLNREIGRIEEIAQSDSLSSLSGQPHFTGMVGTYYGLYIAHMRYEEAEIYPLVETTLSITDWKRILRESPDIPDPLFGKTPDTAFEGLKAAIDSNEAVTVASEIPRP